MTTLQAASTLNERASTTTEAVPLVIHSLRILTRFAILTSVVRLILALKMTSPSSFGSQESCGTVTYAAVIEHWHPPRNVDTIFSEMA